MNQASPSPQQNVPLHKQIADLFPKLSAVPTLQPDEWESVEVYYDAIKSSGKNKSETLGMIRKFRKPLLQVLSAWLGLPDDETVNEMQDALADHIVAKASNDGVLSLLLMREFLDGIREETVKDISKQALLPSTYALLDGNVLDDYASRYLKGYLTFCDMKARLRTMMLYDRALSAGFITRELKPSSDLDPRSQKQDIQRIQNVISGASVASNLSNTDVQDGLDAYKSAGGPECQVFDILSNIGANSRKIIFALRERGTAVIRQVDNVEFTTQADFFVMQLVDDLRTVETHPTKSWVPTVARYIAEEAYGDSPFEYVPTKKASKENKIEAMLEKLLKNQDSKMDLHEIVAENAPLDGAPKLILRAEKNGPLLSRAVNDLKQKGVDLSKEVRRLEKIGVQFETTVKDDPYIFKFFVCRDGTSSNYFLPYSDAVRSSKACREFEHHMDTTYDLNVYPGKKIDD